jgi:hypothetical protein
MARLFEYKCKNCGYTKAANPKGHDMIMSGNTRGLERCVLKCVLKHQYKGQFTVSLVKDSVIRRAVLL